MKKMKLQACLNLYKIFQYAQDCCRCFFYHIKIGTRLNQIKNQMSAIFQVIKEVWKFYQANFKQAQSRLLFDKLYFLNSAATACIKKLSDVNTRRQLADVMVKVGLILINQ